MSALGIIAGAGDLPRLIAEARRVDGLEYLVCAFEGQVPAWVADHPHAVAPFEKPGVLFAALRRSRVEQVVFAGGMGRPSLNPLRFDMTALRVAPAVMPLLRGGGGDDALLRALAGVFEREGFAMIGAHQALAALLAPEGALSETQPDAAAMADVVRAAALVDVIGAQDIGQGAVVAKGLCLGLETLQGTDALLDFVKATPAGLRPAPGVLFKGPKPGQDRRLDLPAIGPATLARAATAGLAGVAVRAGAVLVLGMAATRAQADADGLFLLGWTPAP